MLTQMVNIGLLILKSKRITNYEIMDNNFNSNGIVTLLLLLSLFPFKLLLAQESSPYVASAYTADHKNHPLAGRSGYCDSVNLNIIKVDSLRGSPIRVTSFDQSGVTLEIVYGSPGVKNRIIWGGLVAMNQVWITGAHNATRLTITRPFIIGDKQIEAGSYALFTIPNEKAWTVIINENYKQHLADDYDSKKDIVRIHVIPEIVKKSVQRLTYTVKRVNRRSKNIIFSMEWDKLRLTIPVQFPNESNLN